MPQRALGSSDRYVPVTGRFSPPSTPRRPDGVSELTARAFLRPDSRRLRHLDRRELRRITRAIRDAATRGEVLHLRWHPHSFGCDLDANLALLEQVLRRSRALADDHGMHSQTMG